MGSPAPPCSWAICDDHLELKVRLTPKSQQDQVEGLVKFGDEEVLKARVRAQPSEGAANRALEILCAKWLSVPKSSVKISSGSKSRVKTLRVYGDPIDLETRITGSLKRLKT